MVISSTVYARQNDSPDPALLEFIAGSVQAGDELIDPVKLQSLQRAAHKTSQPDPSQKPRPAPGDGKKNQEQPHE